jgi:hypothetical protein
MTEPGKIPEIDAASLRDHGESEKLERVWARLQGEIETSSAVPNAPALWWALPRPWSSCSGWSLRRTLQSERAGGTRTVSAEPPEPAEPGPAPEPSPVLAEPQRTPDKARKRRPVSPVPEPEPVAVEEPLRRSACRRRLRDPRRARVRPSGSAWETSGNMAQRGRRSIATADSTWRLRGPPPSSSWP